MDYPHSIIAEHRLARYNEQPLYAGIAKDGEMKIPEKKAQSSSEKEEKKTKPDTKKIEAAKKAEEVSKTAQTEAARKIDATQSGLSGFGKFFGFLGRVLPFAFLGGASMFSQRSQPQAASVSQEKSGSMYSQFGNPNGNMSMPRPMGFGSQNSSGGSLAQQYPQIEEPRSLPTEPETPVTPSRSDDRATASTGPGDMNEIRRLEQKLMNMPYPGEASPAYAQWRADMDRLSALSSKIGYRPELGRFT
jgi:hypothetical protein